MNNMIDSGSYTDQLEGKVYKTLKIGSEIWLAEDLNVNKFRNGDAIPFANNDDDWDDAGNKSMPLTGYNPMYKKSRTERFGKFYNKHAILDHRGFLPEGLRIPTNEEWQELCQLLDGFKKEERDNIKCLYSKGSSDFNLSINGSYSLIDGCNEWYMDSAFYWCDTLDCHFNYILEKQDPYINYEIGASDAYPIRCIVEKNNNVTQDSASEEIDDFDDFE